jgi:hypothetical protein
MLPSLDHIMFQMVEGIDPRCPRHLCMWPYRGTIYKSHNRGVFGLPLLKIETI